MGQASLTNMSALAASGADGYILAGRDSNDPAGTAGSSRSPRGVKRFEAEHWLAGRALAAPAAAAAAVQSAPA